MLLTLEDCSWKLCMKEQHQRKINVTNQIILPKHDVGRLRTRRSLSAWPALERRRRRTPARRYQPTSRVRPNNVEAKAVPPTSPHRSGSASSVLVSSSCVDTVLARESWISIRQYIYYKALSRGQPSFLYHLLILMISCFSFRNQTVL